MEKGKHDNLAMHRIVIVGGGTAGWMAAAAITRFLGGSPRKVTLVESDAIGIVGVGEATVPPIRSFNKMLGIEESDFLRATRGTIKLGIEFVDWGRIGDRYIHPFGAAGQDFHGVPFHQLLLREKVHGRPSNLPDYSMSATAAREGRYAPPREGERTPLAHIAHAYHFDASLYACLLRDYAEERGVTRQEGRITKVHQNSESGDVTAVELEAGQRIEGDLFIDCSGFRGLLIEETLGTGYEDWSQYLPMDRALAVPTANIGPPDPFTRATAHTAGWQWRIPLQHRTGNGIVFSSAFMEEDEAERILRANLEGDVLSEPRLLKFTTGMRRKAWNRNVVALGLSSGFLEPLESTSIYLIQHGIARLAALFPGKPINPAERDEYNGNLAETYRNIRDFLILHYYATERDDSLFWQHMCENPIPDGLAHKLELWRAHGRLFPREADMFEIPSWVAVLMGQNVWPEDYDPVVDGLVAEHVTAAFANMRSAYRQTAIQLPTHEEYLRRTGAWADKEEIAA